MSEHDDDRLLEQIKHQLDESVQHMDAATQSRLTAIRHRAMSTTAKPTWSWHIPAVALGSTAAIVAVTVSLLWAPATLQQSSLQDLPLLSSNDAFELIDEVEFYQWLADETQHG